MHIYDTLLKKKKEVSEKNVYIYVCGLTPYDNAHLGHARTYIMFDVLKRYLMYKGFSVLHVQNITDVDDKIIKRSIETGRNPIELATYFHNKALELFDKLNIIRADFYPRVSEKINRIIELIKKIMQNNYAYETSTGVYFDVEKFKDYGKLSKQKLDEIKEKHRIEPDKTKKNAVDFALWKKTTKGEEPVGWNSPWGYGRPGWHIECSAMSLEHGHVNIHGGAKDLIFPHHENEIAQSEAATGKKFVDIWMHTGFLTVEGVKMSKSLGNFITIEEALKTTDPNVLRFFFITKKYSSPVDYSKKHIEDARASLERVKEAANRVMKKVNSVNKTLRDKVIAYRKEFFKALDDDLDTPRALASLFKAINEINKSEDSAAFQLMRLWLEEFSFILGIDIGIKALSKREKELITLLINVRNKLRKEKRFDLSDEIRSKMEKVGIKLKDSKDGSDYSII